VYPQKQQYAYAGYPAPAAYPGPYYHGSQYGPYNYWRNSADRHRWKESIPSTALVANIENSHHLAERGPKIFNTKSEKLVKVDPLIALRDAKDRSEGSSDRVDLERKLNFISKFVASDITRDVTPWDSQICNSFLPVINRSFDSIRPEAKIPGNTKIRKMSKRSPKGIWKMRVFLWSFFTASFGRSYYSSIWKLNACASCSKNTRTF